MLDQFDESAPGLRSAFRLMMGRDADDATRANLAAAFGAMREPVLGCVAHLWHSREFQSRLEAEAEAIAGFLINGARIRLVSTRLPAARRILDLGGANAPLYTMGYAARFERYILVDLPPEGRCEMYQHVEPELPEGVSLHLGDMTDLGFLPAASCDLVWSGQSIEHISLDAGRRMVAEAARVLEPGGWLCLDTPNRVATAAQMRDLGGGFIHPEHRHEYRPDELRAVLEGAGFVIEEALGVCELPTLASAGVYDPVDFVRGLPLTHDPAGAYIQYFRCRKPA